MPNQVWAREYWNIDIKRKLLIYSFINFSVQKNIANKPLSHFPITHHSIIPVFQHSNYERSELSSYQGAKDEIGL